MKLHWKMAQIGLYWYANRFSISSCITIENNHVVQKGYKLLRDRESLGMFDTLQLAQSYAERSSRCRLNT